MDLPGEHHAEVSMALGAYDDTSRLTVMRRGIMIKTLR